MLLRAPRDGSDLTVYVCVTCEAGYSRGRCENQPAHAGPEPGAMIMWIARLDQGAPLRTTPTCPMSSRTMRAPLTPTISSRPRMPARKVSERRLRWLAKSVRTHGGGAPRTLSGGATRPDACPGRVRGRAIHREGLARSRALFSDSCGRDGATWTSQRSHPGAGNCDRWSVEKRPQSQPPSL